MPKELKENHFINFYLLLQNIKKYTGRTCQVSCTAHQSVPPPLKAGAASHLPCSGTQKSQSSAVSVFHVPGEVGMPDLQSCEVQEKRGSSDRQQPG